MHDKTFTYIHIYIYRWWEKLFTSIICIATRGRNTQVGKHVQELNSLSMAHWYCQPLRQSFWTSHFNMLTRRINWARTQGFRYCLRLHSFLKSPLKAKWRVCLHWMRYCRRSIWLHSWHSLIMSWLIEPWSHSLKNFHEDGSKSHCNSKARKCGKKNSYNSLHMKL